MLQRRPRARYRINHISWWAQELPSDEEYAEARHSLDSVGWEVDYIITHCAPTSIALMGSRHNEADRAHGLPARGTGKSKIPLLAVRPLSR